MSGHILILACLLAICLPIISVQLPRTTLFINNRSKLYAVTRPEVLRRSTTIRRHSRRRQQDPSGFGTDGTTSADSRTSENEATKKRQESLLKGGRKPWDPPFPKRESAAATKGEWFVLPRVLPRQTREEIEERDAAVQSFLPNMDGDAEADEQDEPRPHEHDAVQGGSSQHHPRMKASSTSMSGLWLIVAGLAILLFILAFAILIAHCLAWFLVYKTEARLGEARRGLLKGGEMRLCLCAT